MTVSALLWSSGTETLGVVIFNLDDSGETVMASALALSVVLVVVLLMALMQGLSRYLPHHLPRGILPWQR